MRLFSVTLRVARQRPAILASCLLFGIAAYSENATNAVGTPALYWHSTSNEASGQLFIAPDGSGQTLDSQGLSIWVQLIDDFGPVVGYPANDISVFNFADNTKLTLCNAGIAADADTDALGFTSISGPIAGGDNCTQLNVTLAGHRIGGQINIAVASSDFDVDADDLSLLPGDFADFFSQSACP
jgi:hypothetical protein